MGIAEMQTLFQCLANCTPASQPSLDPSIDTPTLEYCTTPGCIESANNFFQSIDVNVDPCDDFYAHACGKWVRETRLPDEKSSLSRFTVLTDLVDNRLEALLSSVSESESNSASIREAKGLYRSCIDLDSRESYGLKPLHAALQDLGGWPLLGNARDTPAEVDLTTLLATLSRDYDTTPLVHLGVSMDDIHPENNILWIHEGSLGLPGRDYFVVEDQFMKNVRRNYLEFMVEVGALLLSDLGKPVERDSLKDNFEKVLEFEKKIAMVHRSPVQNRDPWDKMNYYTLKNASESFRWINWTEYLRVLMPEDTQALISDHLVHINAAPAYFSEMNSIMQEANRETVINYVYWRFVQRWVYSLNGAMRKLANDFEMKMSGKVAPEKLWKDCVAALQAGALGKATGALYARKYFTADFKKKVEILVRSIIGQFKEKILKPSTFMDSETKKGALEKIDSITSMLTYMDYVINDTLLDQEHKNLSLPTSVSYFVKSSNLAKWKIKDSFLKLWTPFERKFETSAAVVNSFYSPAINGISLPGGILAAPFYSSDNIKAINYGSIAAIIGHELSHGFDDRGSQFDKAGKLTKWWTINSENKYNQLKNCFVDQYGAYLVTQANMTINGNLTLGENIADNGGVRTSYLAYKSDLPITETHDMPGLEKYTNDQLFFLSYANIWCKKTTTEFAIQLLRTDGHSPSEARVNIPLMNFETFSRTFNCPVGSKMNPTLDRKRCRLW